MGKKPDLQHLRKVGSRAYVHIRKQHRKGKFQKRATVGVLVGYEMGNSYRVYVPEEDQVVVSRDVTFHEAQSYQKR